MFGGERGAAAVTNFSSENEGLQHVVIQLVGWAEPAKPYDSPAKTLVSREFAKAQAR